MTRFSKNLDIFLVVFFGLEQCYRRQGESVSAGGRNFKQQPIFKPGWLVTRSSWGLFHIVMHWLRQGVLNAHLESKCVLVLRASVQERSADWVFCSHQQCSCDWEIELFLLFKSSTPIRIFITSVKFLQFLYSQHPWVVGPMIVYRETPDLGMMHAV